MMKPLIKKLIGFIVTMVFVFAQIVASLFLFAASPNVFFVVFCLLCIVGMSFFAVLVLKKLGFEKIGMEFVFLYGFMFYCVSYFTADFVASDGAEAVLSIFVLNLFVGLPSIILCLILSRRKRGTTGKTDKCPKLAGVNE